MRSLNFVFMICLVVIPTTFGAFGLTTQMSVATVATAIALCFNNLEKFHRFKGAGFEAELRSAVNKAYAAIEELKELALSVSAPIVDELAISGRFTQYIHLKYKLERVNKIAATLQKLGATADEVEEVCSTLYRRVTDDHINVVLDGLKRINPTKVCILEEIDQDDIAQWNRTEFEKYIKNNNLQKDEDVTEALRDLEMFLSTRTLRREDKWQS